MQSDVIPDVAQSDRDVIADLERLGAALIENHTEVFTHDGIETDALAILSAAIAILTRAPDPDVAALCERGRHHAVDLEQCSLYADDVSDKIGDAMRSAAKFARDAADRLESLSRQLSDAQRERDELRAAVRKKLNDLERKYVESAEYDYGALNTVIAIYQVLDAIPEHTEGGKP